MIEKIEKIFIEITKIPHCSEKTSQLKEYIKKFAKKYGYLVREDSIGNVISYGSNSKITLQSHYDMVCIGRAPKIETMVKNGWMYAKESSLGADNGMGVAMMLYLIQNRIPADFLFTNDEEIGLVGAKNLQLEIKTPYLLNLDSEEAGKVYIGCAGGEDIHLQKRADSFYPVAEGTYYKVFADTPGGHSGVNIADNIPNAITELCSLIVKNRTMEVARIEGGERINAIPSHAEATVWMPKGEEPIGMGEYLHIKRVDRVQGPLFKEGREFAKAVFGFAHGVRAWNTKLGLPQSSINLAKFSLSDNVARLDLSARAMSDKDLCRLVEQSIAGWEALGFSGETEGKYPAWKPETTFFSEKIIELYKKRYPDASYSAIHAGLECALFAKRFPSLQIVSIGPTILDPHSTRERVDLHSVEDVMFVVKRIVSDLSGV